ncbi:MAG: hypothetical protein WC284_11510 [Candidimonas sp.]
MKLIKTEEEYKSAITRLSELENYPLNSPEYDEYEILQILCEKYEEENEFKNIKFPDPSLSLKQYIKWIEELTTFFCSRNKNRMWPDKNPEWENISEDEIKRLKWCLRPRKLSDFKLDGTIVGLEYDFETTINTQYMKELFDTHKWNENCFFLIGEVEGTHGHILISHTSGFILPGMWHNFEFFVKLDI